MLLLRRCHWYAGFGTGSAIQECFFLVQYIEDSAMSLRCLGPFYIVVVLLHIIFIYGQTFFIFKSHEVRLYSDTATINITRIGFALKPGYALCQRTRCYYVIFSRNSHKFVRRWDIQKAFYECCVKNGLIWLCVDCCQETQDHYAVRFHAHGCRKHLRLDRYDRQRNSTRILHLRTPSFFHHRTQPVWRCR